MSQFPLYTTLIKGLPKKDLTIMQKSDLIRKIKDLDTSAHELLYVLIKCYYLEHDSKETLTIPYKGTLSKDKIDFDLNDFPQQLKQLLYKFVNIHKKKLQEDEELSLQVKKEKQTETK